MTIESRRISRKRRRDRGTRRAASTDKTLKLWDAWNRGTGNCLATWKGHSEEVWSVAVFPSGDRVVSGSDDMTLRLWDASTGDCLATWKGRSTYVNSVAVFPAGDRVVSGSADNTLKLWGAASQT